MAIAWKDVINKPDYQALSPEQKAQAQEQYFNQVIAPQAGDKAEAAKQQFYSSYPLGVIEKGNIDIHSRPIVRNEDGSISTVRSMSTNIDGREVLIPTVSDDGRIMSDDEAIDNFMRTGKHLGMFDTPDNATAYAESLHNQQADEYLPKQGNQQQAKQQPQQQVPQQEEQGLISQGLSAAKEAITGAGRMTPQMEQLQPVGNAPELNELSMNAAKMGLAQLFGSDKSQEQILQQMGAKIRQDEKGNSIVDLPSGSYALNKPGLSPQDVTSGIAEMLAFAPAAKAATVPRAALGAAATEAGTKGLVQAAGGEDVNPIDVGLAGGLGAFGKGLENAAGALYRGIKGAPTGEAAVAKEFAESAGVPLMTSDVVPPQTFVGKSAQAAAEKIPVAGTGAPRAAQQQARSKLVEDFANKFGEYNPADIVDSLQRQRSKVKQAVSNRYNEIAKSMEGVQVNPSNAISQIDNEIGKLSRLGSVGDNQTIQKLTDYKNELLRDSMAGGVPFDKLQKIRTQFRIDVKGERPTLPNQSDAAIQRVYSSLTKDMDESLAGNLGPEQLSRWKQADRMTAKQADIAKRTGLKNVLKKGDINPSTVNTMLYNSSPSEVKALYSSLDSKGRNAMRAGILAKAWEKSGGSPDRFLNHIDKIGDQIGIAFKGSDKAYVNGLKTYLDYTRRAGKAGVLNPNGQEIFQLAAPAALVGDVVGTGGTGAMTAASLGGIARLYESKPVRNALLRLNSIKKGSTAFEQQAAKVQELMTSALQASRD